MKTGANDLGTIENQSGHAKHKNGTQCPRYCRKQVRANKIWKWDSTHAVPPKMTPGAQNVKTGPSTLGTAENESGHSKKKTRPDTISSAEKCSGAQNMKTGLGALSTAQN
jgi:hypothetical protein